jgi:hypothetical protein
MSYNDNIPIYINLIKQFCQREILAKQFDTEYRAIWDKDRDEEYRKIKSWSRRYDVDLQESLLKGDISFDAFSSKWNDLWGITDVMAKIRDVLGRVYTACDCFLDDVPDNEINPPLVISGRLLYEEVTDCLLELEKLLKIQ